MKQNNTLMYKNFVPCMHFPLQNAFMDANANKKVIIRIFHDSGYGEKGNSRGIRETGV